MRIGYKSIFIYILIFNLVQARDCEKQAKALARLTPSGLEKVVKIGLEEATPYIHEGVKTMEKQDFHIKADPKKCRPDKLAGMEIGESYKECPRFPKILVAKEGIPLSEIKESVKSTPSDISFKDVSIEDIKLGAPIVTCEGTSCDIEVPVERFKLTSDLKASEMGQGDNYLDIEGLTVAIKSTPETKPSLKFKADLNADGSLKDFVSFPDNFLDAKLALGNISVGVGGRESLDDFMNESVDNFLKGDYLEKVQEDFTKLAVQIYGPDGEYKHLSKDERYRLAKKYISEKMDFTVDQISSSAAKKGMSQALSYTKGDLSALTFLVADGLTSNNVEIVDILLQKSLPQITKSVEEMTKKNLKPFTSNLPFIHEPFNVEMMNLRAQDFVDNEQINYYKRKIDKLVDQCKNNFRKSECRFSFGNKLKRLLLDSSDSSNIELVDQMNSKLRDMINHLQANPSKGFFSDARWEKKMIKDMKTFLDDEKNIKNSISKKSKKLNEQLALNVAVKEVISAKDNIDFLVSACSSGCTQLELSNVQSRTFPKIDRPYDMAMTINVEAINDYIASIQKQGLLDVCLVEGVMVHCGDFNIFGTENKISFKKPPRIEWDEKQKSFLLKMDDIHRNQDIIGLPSWLTGSAEYTSLEIPFELKVSPDGKEFSLSPKGEISAEYDTDKNKLLLPTVLTFAVAPYAGLAFEAIHRSAHSALLEMGEDAIIEGVGTGISLQENLPIERIVEIRNNSSEVTIYADLADSMP